MNLFDPQAFEQIPGQTAMDTDQITTPPERVKVLTHCSTGHYVSLQWVVVEPTEWGDCDQFFETLGAALAWIERFNAEHAA